MSASRAITQSLASYLRKETAGTKGMRNKNTVRYASAEKSAASVILDVREISTVSASLN